MVSYLNGNLAHVGEHVHGSSEKWGESTQTWTACGRQCKPMAAS